MAEYFSLFRPISFWIAFWQSEQSQQQSSRSRGFNTKLRASTKPAETAFSNCFLKPLKLFVYKATLAENGLESRKWECRHTHSGRASVASSSLSSTENFFFRRFLSYLKRKERRYVD